MRNFKIMQKHIYFYLCKNIQYIQEKKLLDYTSSSIIYSSLQLILLSIRNLILKSV